MAEPAAPADDMAPWTVKSLPTRTRTMISTAARREGVTVGQWIERRVDDWEAEGGPVRVALPEQPAAPAPTGSEPSLTEMATLLTALATAKAAGVSKAVLGPVGAALVDVAKARRRLLPKASSSLPLEGLDDRKTPSFPSSLPSFPPSEGGA
jgi:hypothetical protein